MKTAKHTVKKVKTISFLEKAWIVFWFIAVVILSLEESRIPPVYMGKLFGILGSFTLFFLAFLSWRTGDLFWLEGKCPNQSCAPEQTEKTDGQTDNRTYALRLSLIFLIGLILQFLYAVYAVRCCRVSILRDSMVSASILCGTVRIGMFYLSR